MPEGFPRSPQQWITEHFQKEKTITLQKIVISILALIQIINGSVGFTMYHLMHEEYVPRFRNYMEPEEGRQFILICFFVDIFLGVSLLTIWKPSKSTLRFWLVSTVLGTLVTSITFVWALPYGYSTPWQIELIFHIGLAYRILQLGVVGKFYLLYSKFRDEEYEMNLMPRPLPRVEATWPAKRDSNVPISPIIPVD